MSITVVALFSNSRQAWVVDAVMSGQDSSMRAARWADTVPACFRVSVFTLPKLDKRVTAQAALPQEYVTLAEWN